MKTNGNGKFENYKTVSETLSNGLRIIHLPFPSEISYCGIAVNTGARDECEEEHGMAHFIEHLLFKGTKKRRAHHIISRMENVGGELNAYTTKEETFIYATFLNEYHERAMELIGDVVFHSTFPANQIHKEREVILDEINSYIDAPSELIYDDFENMMFQGHEIGHYILGNPHTLERFDESGVKKFYQRQYHPENMILFSFGRIPFTKVMKLTEKYFGEKLSSDVFPKKRVKPIGISPQKVTMDKDTAQTHTILGGVAYDMFHPDRFTLSLLNNIIGGGVINSRLNNSLREKNGLVYHVESILTSYTDTGLLSIYFACDDKNVGRCLKLIDKELLKIRETALTPAQLATAKRQYKGQMGIAFEYNETVALRMAKSFLHHGKYFALDEVFARLDAITSDDILRVAGEVLDPVKFSKLSYK